jgi:hypothetical protein
VRHCSGTASSCCYSEPAEDNEVAYLIANAHLLTLLVVARGLGLPLSEHQRGNGSKARLRPLQGVGMKADRIGPDNAFSTSTSIIFCRIWSDADITRMRLRMRIYSDVGYGAESDRSRSGLRCIARIHVPYLKWPLCFSHDSYSRIIHAYIQF